MNNVKIKKVALVTGASGDIGKAIAKKLASEGYDLFLSYNTDISSIQLLINDIKNICRVGYCTLDLSNKQSIDDFYKQAYSFYGKFDVLVNNAGMSSYNLLIDEDYDTITKCVSTNLIGTIYLTSLISKNMLFNHSGSIINIGSFYSRVGGAMESTYSSTKSALVGWTTSLSSELGPNGIRVNNIAPGAIDTKMNKHFSAEEQNEFIQNLAVRRIGNPSDVANLVCYIASDEAGYISGQTIYIDGGYN